MNPGGENSQVQIQDSGRTDGPMVFTRSAAYPARSFTEAGKRSSGIQIAN